MKLSPTLKLYILILLFSLVLSATSVFSFYNIVLQPEHGGIIEASTIRKFQYIVLSMISTSLLFAVLAIVLSSRWLGQITQFQNGVERVRAGNFNTVINLGNKDELVFLADAFNSMVVALRDRTQALIAKNNTLQQRVQLKDEILANTSHELRTPLNNIIEITESLLDGGAGQLSEAQKINLAMVLQGSRRLSNLVNEILDTSKLEHKPLELQLQAVEMREVTNVVLKLAQPLVGTKPLQLINTISVETPRVYADRIRVQQILYNLVSNAIKFTQTGVVKVSATVMENQLEITIIDTGIGISNERREQVFEWFEDVEKGTAREHDSPGLGLAITQQLVEQHGGKLRVESTVDQGSRFTFTLPIVQNLPLENLTAVEKMPMLLQPASSSLPQHELLTSPDALKLPAGEFKILVVDHQPLDLEELANHLSPQNNCLVQELTGIEAIAELERGFKPDLIILDIGLPYSVVYEIYQRICDYFSMAELPIILLTTKSQTSDLVEGLSYGANDYLAKPITKSEFLARIRTHIQLSKINAAYGRFVPHELLCLLGHDSIVDVKLGDHVQREMTILFSDIRSFMTFSEQMSPEENFNFINAYLKRVVPTIKKHNGFVDKYIGDAVMAVFPEKVEDALLAAINMQKQVRLYNSQRSKNGELPIAIGIGLHAGSLMLGTIGEEQRMEGTVISDAVNVASRLEGLTKLYGASIIFSEKILMGLSDPTKHNYRFLGKVPVKGRKDAVSVFEAFDGESSDCVELKVRSRSNFELGIYFYYSRKFAEGCQIFQTVLKENPQDKAACLYLERCQKFHEQWVSGEWDNFDNFGNKV